MDHRVTDHAVPKMMVKQQSASFEILLLLANEEERTPIVYLLSEKLAAYL